jgi:hypothetical protein
MNNEVEGGQNRPLTKKHVARFEDYKDGDRASSRTRMG